MTVSSSAPAPLPNVLELESELAEEAIRLNLEEAEGFMDAYNELLEGAAGDYPDVNDPGIDLKGEDWISRAAEDVASNYITPSTRETHTRIIKAYHKWQLSRDPSYRTDEVSARTPYLVRNFIQHKCGPKSEGHEGCKFATAISTRAALTFYFKNLRPNEDVAEWRAYDNGTCCGLPTRSRIVSEYMIGLEKMKAKAGEISHSARALTLEDMHRLHAYCLREDQSAAEKRWGVIRYNAYLHAFLMMLRIDEVLKLTFEDLEVIPSEREYYRMRMLTRKCAQTGVQHTWKIYANDRDERLCGMRGNILMATLYGSSTEPTGPLFRQVDKLGKITTQPVTASLLSRWLAADLQAIGYTSWALYGTHSFRRGGCQYRLKVKHWTVDMVAAWGGWSRVEALTMFRYFYSPDDNHEHMDEYDRNLPKRMRVE